MTAKHRKAPIAKGSSRLYSAISPPIKAPLMPTNRDRISAFPDMTGISCALFFSFSESMSHAIKVPLYKADPKAAKSSERRSCGNVLEKL